MFESKYGISYPVRFPTRTQYSEQLDRLGRQGPARVSQCSGQDLNRFQTPQLGGCGQTEYIDVLGQRRTIDLNYPYALVMYKPRPLERYFQTKERALLEVPRCGEWQIIHLPSGEIVYQPSSAPQVVC